MEVPHRADYKQGDIINQRYQVEKSLGEGAFGQVFKVIDMRDSLNPVRALKLLRLWDVPSDLRQPLIDRFKMEFETGQIQSKYLVHSTDYGFANGNPFIVMEFCPGGDMSKIIGHPEMDIGRYAANILHGLHDLHVNGKVHRDLKPENVLFREDGTAVLTDFGICGDRTKRMTERNIFGKPYQIFGTYAYMPPEQVNRARGEATVLPTTDIFSFGVMIYQILTGYLPFGRLEDQNDLVQYQKRGKAGDWDAYRLDSVPNGHYWSKIISGCLTPNFKERTQSAKRIIEKLAQFYDPNQINLSQSIISPSNISQSVISQQSVPLNPVVLMSDSLNQHCLRDIGGGKAIDYQLHIMQGEEYGRIIDITKIRKQLNRLMLSVGRHSSNVIPITELLSCYISRFHCTLEFNPNRNRWRIRDGQWRPDERVWRLSSNGSFVNSTEVTQEGIELEIGDIISIGDVKMRVEQY